MIGHYLSSNNEMCYNIKTNNFSPTKHDLRLSAVGTQSHPEPHPTVAFGVWICCSGVLGGVRYHSGRRSITYSQGRSRKTLRRRCGVGPASWRVEPQPPPALLLALGGCVVVLDLRCPPTVAPLAAVHRSTTIFDGSAVEEGARVWGNKKGGRGGGV